METATRILVVEDDPDIAEVVRRGLRLAGFAVDVVGDGRDALIELGVSMPDLLLLDLMLPDMDGMELCRRLRAMEAAEKAHPLPVLMMTARGTVPEKVAGLRAGADDYVVKPFAFEELLARIQALLRRSRGSAESRIPSSDILFADVRLDPKARMVERGGEAVHLSAREFELLELLMRHPNQVMTRALLMERFWSDYYGESNVLEVMIASLRQALEAGGRPRLIHTVRGVGYVLRLPS